MGGFRLKGDQRKKAEQHPIPSSLPEATGFGFGFIGGGHHRRKEGVSYTSQVRFSGEISTDMMRRAVLVPLLLRLSFMIRFSYH